MDFVKRQVNESGLFSVDSVDLTTGALSRVEKQ